MHDTPDTTAIAWRVRSAAQTKRYHTILGMVGDAGLPVRPLRARRRSSAFKTLIRLAWLPLSFFFIAASMCAAPGDLDPTFAAHGKLEFGFGRSRREPADIAVQSDDKILVISAGTKTPTSTPTPTATHGSPSRFANMSTRLHVKTGDNVLIGGFIVGG